MCCITFNAIILEMSCKKEKEKKKQLSLSRSECVWFGYKEKQDVKLIFQPNNVLMLTYID